MIFRNLIACAVLAGVSLPGVAGDVSVTQDGGLTWQAGVDGVEIEWKPDGSIKRLSSRYSTPVEFADRRGISKAQIIAEEKAKANIIRFMDQSISSTRVVAEVQSDVNKATQQRGTAQSTTVNKVDERVVMESLTEVTASFAAGKLKGVIILERGYDDKAQEAWVTVGISERSIAAANRIQSISNDRSQSPQSSGTETTSTGTAGTGTIGIQSSEVRRARQQDW